MTKDKIVKKSISKKIKGKSTPYNMFMKTEIPKVKAADSNLEHRAAFTIAAKNWATASENPKNAK